MLGSLTGGSQKPKRTYQSRITCRNTSSEFTVSFNFVFLIGGPNWASGAQISLLQVAT